MNVDSMRSEHSPIIQHQQLERIMEEYDRCCRLTQQYSDQHCMSIEGPTGAGKTRLAEELVRFNPPYAGAEGVIWPVFHFQLPADPTPKQVAVALLEELGDPTPRRDNPKTRVIQVINQVVRDAVILDDFHHLLNVNTPKRRDSVTDQLKVMIKKTNKVFVIIGIEGKMREIIGHDPQLGRFFSCSMQLEPFPLDPNAGFNTYQAQIQEFDLFVRRAIVQLNIEIVHDLLAEEFLRRLHAATGGVVANILNLFRYAKDLGLERNKEIDLSILSQAYERRMKSQLDRQDRHKSPFDIAGRKLDNRSI